MRARLGIGLAAVGRPAYITAGRERDLPPDRSAEALQRQSFAVLDAAYDVGIRYADVARSYGRAEEFLAAWLAARPATTDVVVGSKWGYTYVGDWRLDADVHEVKDHNRATFERQYAESRALLGSRLAVYHVHSATLDSGVLDDTALHAALARLREDEVEIGLSTSGPRQGDTVRRALDVSVDGEPLFHVVQATWNILEPSAGPALEEAFEAGWSVTVKEGVANGRLTEGGDCVLLHAVAERLGATPDAVALAAAMAQPWAAIVLSGAVTPEQVRSNAAAVDVTLDSDTVAELRAAAEDPAAYWSARSGRPWH